MLVHDDQDNLILHFNSTSSYNNLTFAGVQGQLWSELVRTSDQLESMIFPRLIAMAERAWHKASWENETDKTKRDAESKKDWAAFANSLGSKELARLDALQIAYHIVPPGARLVLLLLIPFIF